MVNADMEPERTPADMIADLRHRSLNTDEERWVACLAQMAAAGKAAAGPLYGTVRGRVVLGKGAGGDRTLEIDRACEAAIQEVLAAEAPGAYQLVSEEAGVVGPAGAPWRVVVDPLDGSLNAKHGLELFGTSLAVARGGALGDVAVGHVQDYTRPHTFAAVKGAGLLLGGENGKGAQRLYDADRLADAAVEVLLIEAGRPERHDFRYSDLSSIVGGQDTKDLRVRQIGSLALSLCYLAMGVADVLVAAVHARSVDVAAGFLILHEAGGSIAALDDTDIWGQPLDLERRGAFVAWRRGVDGAEITTRARRLRKSLLFRP